MFTLTLGTHLGTPWGLEVRDFIAANTMPSTPRSIIDSTASFSCSSSPAVSAMRRK
jgi:hypothetical protein